MKDRVHDHITRAVREDDRQAFAAMDAKTSYADLDPSLKRYRDDIFDDKYKRLDADDIGRTIVAHLAKDGYGFIHPEQDRTISVREAARLQTFPDWVRFAGPPTAAFRQIGNAVPPLLAETIAGAALEALAARVPAPTSTTALSAILARWYQDHGSPSQPWLDAGEAWKVLLGELLLVKTDAETTNAIWPLLNRWRTPAETLASAEDLLRIGGWIGKSEEAALVLDITTRLANRDNAHPSLADLEREAEIPPSTARLVALAAADVDDDILYTERSVLRPVARFFGSSVDTTNRRSDGRVSAARLVGAGENSRLANLALIEIAQSICVSSRPLCPECPLVAECVFAAESGLANQALLF